VTALGSAASLLRESRALRVGVAVGLGLTVRYLVERTARRGPQGLVDWAQAERIARRRLLTAPGRLSTAELEASRPAYAEAMATIVPLLEARLGSALPGVVERHEVVDRVGWARANMGTFRTLMTHLERHLLPAMTGPDARHGMAMAANRFLTTRQVGFILGYLGTRVLGQYDVALLSAERSPGRLLFVEENVRATARSIGVPVERFRTWIALHEATHAFEMEAHPWLRPYLRVRLERQLALFLGEARRLQRHGVRHLARRWRAAAAEGSLAGLLSPEQRRLMAETQRVMSLLEGFSDWVMDEVGAEVIPDVADLRRRFDARRRQRRGTADRIVARLIGLDLKLEQYRRGERFVAGVWRSGGEVALRHLWDGPAALPSEAELSDPEAWVRRVVPRAFEADPEASGATDGDAGSGLAASGGAPS
jgi:coenzyme F420 biosynthesis associated uncharacterized protein